MDNTMTEGRSGSTGMMLAFVGGAALGAVAGILLAPQSGRESRARVREYVKTARDRFGALAKRAKATAEDAIQRSEEMLDERAEHRAGTRR